MCTGIIGKVRSQEQAEHIVALWNKDFTENRRGPLN